MNTRTKKAILVSGNPKNPLQHDSSLEPNHKEKGEIETVKMKIKPAINKTARTQRNREGSDMIVTKQLLKKLNHRHLGWSFETKKNQRRRA